VHVLIIKTGDEITLKAGDSYDTSAGILTAVVTWKSAGNALKGYEMKYVPVEGGKVRLMLSARGKKDTEGTMDITAFEAVREKLAGHARGSMNGALMPGAEIELFRKTFEELANSLKGRAVAPTVPTPLKTRMAINSEALAKVQPKDRVTKVVSMVADGQKPTLFNYISRILNKAGFGKGLAGLTAGAAGQHLVTIEESKAKADAENFIKMIEDAGAEDTSVDRIVAYVPPVKDGKGENIFEKVKRHFANNPRVIIVPDAYSDLNAAENKHPDLVTRIVFARDLDFYFKTGDSRILEAMKDLLNRISANGEAFLKIDKDGKLVGFTGSLEIKPIDYNSIRQWHDTTEAVLMSA
jgi:hypothetical protein